jgi:hypothetical protein
LHSPFRQQKAREIPSWVVKAHSFDGAIQISLLLSVGSYDPAQYIQRTSLSLPVYGLR